MLQELLENCRAQFDFMQANLSRTISMSDAELLAEPDAMDEMFSNLPRHPEARREEARNTQDNLDRKGREACAREYAAEQSMNF